MYMETVSIQGLKSNFARWAGLAAAGTTIQVTRHNRAYVCLTGCAPASVHRGSRVGGSLAPALAGPTKGQWRKILAEDRAGGR